MTGDGRPVLDQINLVVADMEAAVAFYRRLGVEIADSPGGGVWNRHHRTATEAGDVDLDLDSSAFAGLWSAGWPAGGTGAVIGFRVADREAVDRLYTDLTGAGHRGQQEPYDAFWGARYAIVEDPDGNAVGLMSPVDPARRTRPPDPPDTPG
jgi:catechol 2,3-dioxygenase-like lactoylglutathione lyase family enzyme